MTFNIAIDGPAGAGKSTVAKMVAKKLGYIYVDTGAMYRAMAYYLIQKGVRPDETDKMTALCGDVDITIKYENGEQNVYLNGKPVNQYIRMEEVGSMASVCSALAPVRSKLTELQKKLASENNVVMDGRDIGTCVLPDAQIKIYLTADSHVRALRRRDELAAKGESCDLDKIERNIIERDNRDMTRTIAPLKKAEDAVTVDSSGMSADEVLYMILGICNEKLK